MFSSSRDSAFRLEYELTMKVQKYELKSFLSKFSKTSDPTSPSTEEENHWAPCFSLCMSVSCLESQYHTSLAEKLEKTRIFECDKCNKTPVYSQQNVHCSLQINSHILNKENRKINCTFNVVEVLSSFKHIRQTTFCPPLSILHYYHSYSLSSPKMALKELGICPNSSLTILFLTWQVPWLTQSQR